MYHPGAKISIFDLFDGVFAYLWCGFPGDTLFYCVRHQFATACEVYCDEDDFLWRADCLAAEKK